SARRTRSLRRRFPGWISSRTRNENPECASARAEAHSGFLHTMSFAHRYLTQFGPKQTPHLFTDVLVIGAGIAGLRAALEVPRHLQVLVVTKDSIQQSNSTYAQGGIAAVSSPEDRFENHIEDTLTAGAGLCNREVVEVVVREAPNQIQDLIRWGTRFDLEEGQIALTREGGH